MSIKNINFNYFFEFLVISNVSKYDNYCKPPESGCQKVTKQFFKKIEERQCNLKSVVMAWHPCHISFFVQLKLFHVNSISRSRN